MKEELAIVSETTGFYGSHWCDEEQQVRRLQLATLGKKTAAVIIDGHVLSVKKSNAKWLVICLCCLEGLAS